MVGNPIAEATRCRAESDDLCGYTHGPTADRRPNLRVERVVSTHTYALNCILILVSFTDFDVN